MKPLTLSEARRIYRDTELDWTAENFCPLTCDKDCEVPFGMLGKALRSLKKRGLL